EGVRKKRVVSVKDGTSPAKGLPSNSGPTPAVGTFRPVMPDSGASATTTLLAMFTVAPSWSRAVTVSWKGKPGGECWAYTCVPSTTKPSGSNGSSTTVPSDVLPSPQLIVGATPPLKSAGTENGFSSRKRVTAIFTYSIPSTRPRALRSGWTSCGSSRALPTAAVPWTVARLSVVSFSLTV